MQGVIRGFSSQSAEMDPLEWVRRWKRSLDGYISFRKAVLIALCIFAFILYVGPAVFSWLFFGSGPTATSAFDYFDVSQSCINDKLGQTYSQDLRDGNAHIRHSPWWGSRDSHNLFYVGNGHFAVSPDRDDELFRSKFFIRAGAQRVMRTEVDFSPLVKVVADGDFSPAKSHKSATVLSYLKGLVHRVDCYLEGASASSSRREDFSVDHQTYAHRALPEILVQEINLSNPTGTDKLFNTEREGLGNIIDSETEEKKISGQVYKFTKGVVKIEKAFSGFQSMRSPFADTLVKRSKEQQYAIVVVAAPVLSKTYNVGSYKSQTLTVVTAISHSPPLTLDQAKEEARQSDVETKALDAIKRALSLTPEELRLKHDEVWRSLWTTGFGISYSMAEDAVNGQQINATMYYVLSQAPTPLHSLSLSSSKKSELEGHLSYLEGCYGSLPTLHEGRNLWRPLDTLESVNDVAQYWFLNLEVNGCHKLLKAGADGVVQAMVLSFVGLKFRQHHLELDANPKDLHRDFFMRRVCYGNGTHLNISIVVQNDNRAVIDVTLDRKNRDYFACDAGCLDPPVKLSSTEIKRFLVKLTDPVTAVLYVTADYEHMIELKHTIHVKDVMDAPAHEHHVMALHKHGNKLGGLPTIFWFSIGSLILIFHVFLFKLIWQEYCSSGSDKYRSRKY